MKRAVVTGVGAVTPFGFGVATLWQSLVAGKNAITPIRSLPLSAEVVHIAGEMPSALPTPPRRLPHDPEDPSVQLFFEAVREAVDMSGLEFTSGICTDRCGTFIADRVMGQIHYLDAYAPLLQASRAGERQLNEASLLQRLDDANFLPNRWREDPDSINHVAARAYNITGPQLSLSTACASSNSALGEALVKIRHGELDVVIAGGAYNFDLHAMVGFTRIGALTTNADPDVACCPFDANRGGFVMGSGCGILVVEELEHARQRGADVLCELKGYGASCDAFRATDPDPEANGVVRAIQQCLASANIGPHEIDYINAHGTSTKMNDLIETIGIKRALGNHAWSIPVSSTKSMIGHSIMAAGAIEAIACIKTINTNVVHPTRNWRTRDPDLDLDYVPGQARDRVVRNAMSNSFGFGGQNVAILLSRFDA